jgi:DNA-binding response OmpR family regulator
MANKTILIADDEADIVETLAFMLETQDFNVITANDGEDALLKAKEERPDLILLDVMMPKMNGYKVCRLLKFDKQYNNIPILMLTARSQDEDRAIGEETGADEYITKPFDIEEVVEKVKEYLKV